MNAFVLPAKHTFVAIDEIDLGHTIRPYNASVVAELAQSIRTIGLQTPLTRVVRDGQRVLVSGRNRLEALRVIGCGQAPVRVVDFDDLDAQLWRLSEHLHCAELTKLEYDKQVFQYAELLKAKRDCEGRTALAAAGSEIRLQENQSDKVRQVGEVSGGDGISRQLGAKVGPPESGNKLVARELNIPEQTDRRAYHAVVKT
jgi:ParB-like chromosome segregation protein Spo0J